MYSFIFCVTFEPPYSPLCLLSPHTQSLTLLCCPWHFADTWDVASSLSLCQTKFNPTYCPPSRCAGSCSPLCFFWAEPESYWDQHWSSVSCRRWEEGGERKKRMKKTVKQQKTEQRREHISFWSHLLVWVLFLHHVCRNTWMSWNTNTHSQHLSFWRSRWCVQGLTTWWINKSRVVTQTGAVRSVWPSCIFWFFHFEKQQPR